MKNITKLRPGALKCDFKRAPVYLFQESYASFNVIDILLCYGVISRFSDSTPAWPLADALGYGIGELRIVTSLSRVYVLLSVYPVSSAPLVTETRDKAEQRQPCHWWFLYSELGEQMITKKFFHLASSEIKKNKSILVAIFIIECNLLFLNNGTHVHLRNSEWFVYLFFRLVNEMKKFVDHRYIRSCFIL